MLCHVKLIIISFRVSVLSTHNQKAGLDYFLENDQWELIRPVSLVTMSLNAFEDDANTPLTSSALVVTVHLKRRPLFYMVVLICPNLMIYLLSTLVFFLPVESGEKVSYIVTIFLAEIVNVGALTNVFPASSFGFPKLAYFILTVTVHLSLLCVATVAGILLIKLFKSEISELLELF